MQPSVSICCTTFNHVNYISKCIEGFLIQKTDFPIEILIFDDASTDGTQNVVKKYATQDQRIKTFLQSENQWSQNKFGTYDWLFPAAKGKYIAICEGDDFWTDPQKLQKQVNLLEQNPDASFCFSKVDVLFETKMSEHSYLHMDDYPNTITLEDYLDVYHRIPMLTKVFRTSVLRDYNSKELKWSYNVRYPDNVTHMCDLMRGPALFLNEITSTYRVQSQSLTRTAPTDTPWHIEEILLTHYHFAGMTDGLIREKFFAIRALHYCKLLDFHIALKNFVRVISVTLKFLFDSRSGGLSTKFGLIKTTIKRHLG